MSMIGGDAESVSSSRAGGLTPRNRVKFLCSHGGKILPRPVDGHLKYVGGETRVICVSRDITFTDIMKKITSMFDGEMILMYQLMPEDFDVLVTVKTDEDVRHMVDECDRNEYLGGPRLRAFLFQANQVVMVNQLDHHSLEQRYINSVNGIVFHPSPAYNTFTPPPVNTSYTTFSISSACSSPRTPPENTGTANATTGINTESTYNSFHGKPSSLTRNRSSPSLCSLGCNSVSNHQNQNQNQIVTTSPKLNQSHFQQPQQSYHFNPNIHHPQQPHQSLKPPIDRQPGKTRSPYVADYYRHQTDHSPSHNHPRTNRGGHMYHQKGSPYDEYYGNCRYERNDSPPSPDVLPQALSLGQDVNKSRKGFHSDHRN